MSSEPHVIYEKNVVFKTIRTSTMWDYDKCDKAIGVDEDVWVQEDDLIAMPFPFAQTAGIAAPYSIAVLHTHSHTNTHVQISPDSDSFYSAHKAPSSLFFSWTGRAN